MSNRLQELGEAIAMHLDGINAICKSFGYVAIPTLLLRHPEGSHRSIMMGNDDLDEVAACINDLAKREPINVKQPTSMLDPEADA